MNKPLVEIEVKGILREMALNNFHSQIAEWNICMPRVQPYVLDFGLGEFEKTGLIEYWIANEIDAGYCGKFLFVFHNQTCPMHSHKDKHETFFVVRGKIMMICSGKEQIMSAGDLLTMNETQKHSFTGLENALLLEISKPCIVSDNYFENSQIPIGKTQHSRAAQSMSDVFSSAGPAGYLYGF